MKTQYVADDGKVFNTKEAAVAHEAATSKNKDEAKNTLLEKIRINNEKIDELHKKIKNICDESQALMNEYIEKYATEEQKGVFKDLNDLVDYLFGA